MGETRGLFGYCRRRNARRSFIAGIFPGYLEHQQQAYCQCYFTGALDDCYGQTIDALRFRRGRNGTRSSRTNDAVPDGSDCLGCGKSGRKADEAENRSRSSAADVFAGSDARNKPRRFGNYVNRNRRSGRNRRRRQSQIRRNWHRQPAEKPELRIKTACRFITKTARRKRESQRRKNEKGEWVEVDVPVKFTRWDGWFLSIRAA